jgi:phosphatidylethanolamine/phosphatidyl-N-methylethanolamine N-methyltransferase
MQPSSGYKESVRMSRRNVSIADRLGDELRFVKTFATSPLKMGTFTPSGRALAEAMVNHATIDPSAWTLEIGPGTGAVTEVLIERGVPPERLVCLEYDADFCRLLQKRFPTANVIQGDALKLDVALAPFADIRFSAVLSGIPLLNMPKTKRLPYLESALDRLTPGGNVTQLSYGFLPPQDAVPGRLTVDKSKWVTANFPPGRIWIYRRPPSPSASTP